jgi:hypothetical protein
MSEESLDQRLKSLLNQGRKIEAIKLCKEELQIEYNEAKEYIEEIAKGLTSVVTANIPDESPIDQNTKEKNEPTEVKEQPISPIVNSNINSATLEKNPNDDKISLKSKIIMGLVFIVFLKACSYSTNGGEGYGLTHQFLCKIGDTIIPWPESHRSETEADTDITEQVHSENEKEVEPIITDEDESLNETNYAGHYEYKIEAYEDAAIYYMDPNIKHFIGSEYQSLLLASTKIDSLIYHIPSGHKVYVIEDVIRNESGAFVHVYCDGYEGMMDESLLKKK